VSSPGSLLAGVAAAGLAASLEPSFEEEQSLEEGVSLWSSRLWEEPNLQLDLNQQGLGRGLNQGRSPARAAALRDSRRFNGTSGHVHAPRSELTPEAALDEAEPDEVEAQGSSNGPDADILEADFLELGAAPEELGAELRPRHERNESPGAKLQALASASAKKVYFDAAPAKVQAAATSSSPPVRDSPVLAWKAADEAPDLAARSVSEARGGSTGRLEEEARSMSTPRPAGRNLNPLGSKAGSKAQRPHDMPSSALGLVAAMRAAHARKLAEKAAESERVESLRSPSSSGVSPKSRVLLAQQITNWRGR